MGNYRYYCLDAAGQLHRAESFDADSDEQAAQLIRQKHPDCKCEVWNGNRLVATLSPEPLTA